MLVGPCFSFLSAEADLANLPVLAIRAFFKTPRQFSEVLSDSESSLNMSRYFRLMALASTTVFIWFPLDLFETISHLCTRPVKPWISWADTHQYMGQVRFKSQDVYSAQPRVKDLLNLGRWADVGGAFLFFIFFGLSGEVRQGYRRIFSRIVTSLGIKSPAPKHQNSVWYVCFAIYWAVHKHLLHPWLKAPDGLF
jgi:pheromone a factor receptor